MTSSDESVGSWKQTAVACYVGRPRVRVWITGDLSHISTKSLSRIRFRYVSVSCMMELCVNSSSPFRHPQTYVAGHDSNRRIKTELFTVLKRHESVLYTLSVVTNCVIQRNTYIIAENDNNRVY
jgi:hypothetical protein